MRKDEEFCKEQFDEFLRLKERLDICWTEGAEPPDYYLNIGNKRFAVEVTNLMEEVNIGGQEMSHLGFRSTILRFIKRVEEEARQNGILNGAYVVNFKPHDDFGKKKSKIKKEILDYIQETQNSPDAIRKHLLGQGRLSWYIKKDNNTKKYLTCGTFDAKWEGQAQTELCLLLEKVIKGKSRKLNRIKLPKILLILDRYVWLDEESWEQCYDKLSLTKKFHTVFRASKVNQNCILYSIEPSWLTH